MTQAADGRPSFAVSIHPEDAGGSTLVEKRGVDARSSELLRHEREVLSHLSHPNIIELAGRSQPTASDDHGSLVTFLAGRSTLADHPPTEMTAIIRCAAQLSTTLAELHELGWAHGAIAPEHLIGAADGAIIWCSLRRAVPISSPDAPAAMADVAALADVIGTLLPTTPARNGPSRGLATIVTSARHRAPTARRLVVELANLLGDSPPTRRRQMPSRRRSGPTRRPTGSSSARPVPRRPQHARRSPIAGVVLRLVVCLAAIVALSQLGLSSGHGVGSTNELAPALRVAAQITRWAALMASAYGVTVNGLTLAALLSRSRRLAAVAGRFGPSILRRWATGVTSIGLLGSAVVSALTPSPSHATQVIATPPRDTHRSASTTAPTTTRPAATTTTTAPTPASTPDAAPPAGPTSTGQTSTGPTSSVGVPRSNWITAPGDDLWHIAERTLVADGAAAPTNAQIGRYWQRLLAANRDHLSNPDEPDLIYPGQVFELPPIEN